MIAGVFCSGDEAETTIKKLDACAGGNVPVALTAHGVLPDLGHQRSA